MTGLRGIAGNAEARAWAVLPLGAVLVGIYFALPGSLVQPAIYQGVGTAALLALIVGLRANRPPEPLPWWLFVGGFALFVAGDAGWFVYRLLDVEAPYPSIADGLYMAAYPLLIAGVVSLSRRGRPGALGGLFDAAIVGGGTGLLTSAVVLQPIADTYHSHWFAQLTASGYPLLDGILVAAVVQLYAASGARGPSMYALVVGFGTLLVFDTAYGVEILKGTYASGSWVDGGWLACYTAWAFAGLHPSMRNFSRDRERAGRLSLRRLFFVGCAGLVVPVIPLVRDGASAAEMKVAAGCGVAMIVLVFARMALLFREHAALESRLRHAQKMQAVGQLAGGIAHDFNNLLSAIRGSAELALAADRTAQQRYLFDVLEASDRAAGLTQQLLMFGRRQQLEISVVDVNEVVRESETLLRRVIGEQIAVEVECAAATSHVRMDRSQLLQVVLNLAVNARDSMPHGGRLSIRTKNVDRVGPASGQYVQLCVSDTGTGMDDETRSRAFEPFFTTKPVGAGTGLGLATVYGVVEQSNGLVELDSSPGAGTRVTVFLPLTDERSALEVEPLSLPELEKQQASVLLVEDEPAVRTVVASMLAGAGYSVVATGDADEALAACTAQAIDVLVSDVVMPTMDGRELARRVSELHPGVAVVLMSGYPDASGSGDPITFLQKPFSAAELTETVRGALAETQSPVLATLP